MQSPSSHDDLEPTLASTLGEGPRASIGREGETRDAELVAILDLYLEDLRAGKAPSRDELIARHPHLAEQLEACLAGLEFIHQADSGDATHPQRLGDFRLLREVGRGGMGVVYEAEQVSLSRRVAVKVLRFGSVSDPDSIDRFRREAETVAHLHHTNIVPIFFVGIEKGVNYYAMEFIEGRSLAEVLSDSRQPIDPMTAVNWGFQAAEALAHAHQRGVIHRDVKPSNLLIDKEGRIWLTDFGLAKRLDDVTLSLSGALLGTPRYMSPEQASAARHRLDHRTDLYSLGATLYELITGQPVFSADTPHQVIDQILNLEPTPPRRHAPSLSRDIETILLKCLGKEPDQRYPSAQALASDLRAVLDGRPIEARRASLSERATKWARRHRRSLTLTAGSVLATAALLLCVLASLLWWSRRQLVPVILATDQPPLAAEIRDRADQLVVSQTVPTQEPIKIPAGDYQLQVSGKGRMSETYDVQVARGESPRYDLSLDGSLVNMPLRLKRSYQIVSTARGALVVELDDEGLRCWDMHAATLRWTLSLRSSEHPLLTEASGWVWPWNRLQGSGLYSGSGAFDLRPFIVSPGVDLNSDGIDDIILAARHQACLMAVSGHGGNVLWVAGRGHDLGQPIANVSTRYQQGVVSGVLASPAPCGDVDGDGVTDFTALLIDLPGAKEREVVRWIELISGKSGQTLWRRELESRWFTKPAGLGVPESFRWFHGSGLATSRHGPSSGSNREGVIKRVPSRMERTGYFHHVPGPVKLVSWSPGKTQPPRLTLLAGNHVLCFDVKTGDPIGEPLDCGMQPGKVPIVGDFNQDGADELVLIQDLTSQIGAGGSIPRPQVRIGVLSLSDRKLLWTRDAEANWPHADWPLQPVAPPDWPIVADLEEDGRWEMIFPNGNSRYTGRQDQAWGEIEVVDSMTGQSRWRRRLKTMDQQVDWFVTGPDIDGDGIAEIFAATLWSPDFDLYVDALSGRDGRSLWVARETLRKAEESVGYRLGRPLWWRAGTDGWPQLVIPATSEGAVTDPLVRVFSSGTAALTQTGSNLIEFLAQDADGDGIEDLFAFESDSSNAIDHGGTLLCFRGRPAELWNRMGSRVSATVDLDGDAMRDLIETRSDGSFAATSSRDGELLWTSRLTERNLHRLNLVAAVPRQDGFLGAGPIVDESIASGELSASPSPNLPLGDFDRDGTNDLLVYVEGLGTDVATTPLLALSGRTGRRLWSSEMKASSVAGIHALDTRDLDGDGLAEVIWMGASNWGFSESATFTIHQKQLQLAVVSGRDGRLIWHQPLTQRYGERPQTNSAPYEMDNGCVALCYGDLNADGVLDLVVPARLESDSSAVSSGGSSQELRALDGLTGDLIWRCSLPPARDQNRALSEVPPPVIADLDGDLQPEVVVLTFEKRSGEVGSVAVIRVLSGQDGFQRWHREYDVPDECGRIALDGHEGHDVRDRPRPLLLQRQQASPLICLNLWDSPERVIVLQGSGEQVSDFRLETKRGYHRRKFRVWGFDTDEDGNDEILLTNHDRLVAIDPAASADIHWQRDVTNLWTDQIEGIIPASDGQGPQVVIRHADAPASVYAVEATSGRLLWTTPSPSPRRKGNAVIIEPNEIALLSGPREGLSPRLFFQQHFVSWVGEAAFTRDAGPDSVVGNPVASSTRAPVRLSGTGNDPRMRRRLPWLPPDSEPRRLLVPPAWSLFFSITLIYVPLAYFVQTYRYRRWGLRWLGLLPLVVAIWLIAATIQVPDLAARGLAIRLILAIVALPAVVSLVRLGVLAVERHWRALAAWLAATFIASLMLAIIVLAGNQFIEEAALQAGEYYSWDGWWLIWLHGAYVTACALTASLVVVQVWRGAIAGMRRRPRMQGAS